MLEELSHEEFARMTITLWAIWTAQKKTTQEDIFQTPLSTHGFIISFLRELKALVKPTTSRTVTVQKVWKPTPYAIAKVNIDAAVSKTENRVVTDASCLCGFFLWHL
jgi:hypothetical protein